eukprot:gene9657-20083_t
MRSMSHSLGLTHQPELQYCESWRMYLADNDVLVSDKDEISSDQFVKYRRVVERRLPLARDLERLRLGYLPRIQQLWIRLKELIKDVYIHRSDGKTEERLDMNEVAYILCNSGLCFTRTELIQAMIIRTRKEKVIKHMHLKLLKRYLTDADVSDAPIMASGVISAESHENRNRLRLDQDAVAHVLPSELIAWYFSGRNDSQIQMVYSALLNLKYATCRCTATAKWFWDLGTLFRERRCFRSIPELGEHDRKMVGKHTVASDNTTTLTFTAEVGRDPRKDDGLNITWTTVRMEHPITFLASLGLPKDCGSAFTIDFLLRSDVKPNEAKLAATELKSFLTHQLSDELTHNKQFRGLFVSTDTRETEIGTVIRVGIAYRRLSTIDAWFEQTLAPYCLSDILTAFSGSITASDSPADLLDSTYTSIDNQLSGQMSCSLEFRNDLLMDLLQLTNIIFTNLEANARAEIALRANHSDSRLGASLATSGSAGKAKEKKSRFHATVKRPMKDAAGAVPSPFQPSETPEEKADAFDNSLKQVLKWIEWVKAFFRGHKSALVALRFKDFSELLQRLRQLSLPWLAPIIKSIPSEMGRVPGMPGELHLQWLRRVKASFVDIHQRLSEYLENKFENEENVLRNKYEKSKLEQRREDFLDTKKDLVRKLQSLGVNTNEDDLYKEEDTSTKFFLESQEEVQNRNDVQAYETYERLWKVILGLNTAEIIMGRTRVSFSFQGADFMDVFPEVPSIVDVKERAIERVKVLRTQLMRDTNEI